MGNGWLHYDAVLACDGVNIIPSPIRLTAEISASFKGREGCI